MIELCARDARWTIAVKSFLSLLVGKVAFVVEKAALHIGDAAVFGRTFELDRTQSRKGNLKITIEITRESQDEARWRREFELRSCFARDFDRDF